MKNLFLFFFISFTSFSQINEGDLNGGDFVSNYMSFFQYDSSDKTYIPYEDSDPYEGEIFFSFDPYGQWFEMDVEGDSERFWIEFVGKKVFEDVKCDEYNIEDGRVFLVDYKNNRFLFFENKDKNGVFQTLISATNVSKDE